MQILYNKNDCFFFSPLIGSKKILSRGKFFSKKLALVKNTRAEKVGSLSNGVDFSYVNHNEFPFCIYLWKRPVEKLVDSVEKFCLFSALPETAKVEPPKIHRRSLLFPAWVSSCAKKLTGSMPRQGRMIPAMALSIFNKVFWKTMERNSRKSMPLPLFQLFGPKWNLLHHGASVSVTQNATGTLGE